MRWKYAFNKYRDISGAGFKNTQDIFINQRLYLPDLESLNDPNESIAEIQIDNQYKKYGNLLEERNRKKGTRFFSLSETNRSALMWSHYAASHTGICIAFDFSDWQDTESFVLKKVCYVDTPVKMPHSSLSDYKKFAIHKESSWAYEKEWRFISRYDFFYILVLIQSKPFFLEQSLIKHLYVELNTGGMYTIQL